MQSEVDKNSPPMQRLSLHVDKLSRCEGAGGSAKYAQVAESQNTIGNLFSYILKNKGEP